MDPEDTIILYIILRQSLQLNEVETAVYIANAMQHILFKYFTLQLLAVKTSAPSLVNDKHLQITTKWLSSKSKKHIVSADEEIWLKLKNDFNAGKDFFAIKSEEVAQADVETALVFWPEKYSLIPDYIKS